MPGYHPKNIEPRWQQYWLQNQTFRTPDLPTRPGQQKFYVLDMFPYPSGEGLHVGRQSADFHAQQRGDQSHLKLHRP